MQVVGTGRSNGETGVEARHEARQERVAGLDVADLGHAHLLHQPVLQGPVDPFDPTFGLARAGAQDLDGEFGQRPAELGHALAALGVLLGHAEDGMPVAVEGNRAAMGLKIALEGLEVGKGTLRGHEPQLHELAGRIVDEDEQRAGVGTILEPAMLAAIDLDQLAQGLAAQPRLIKASALLAGEP